MCKYDRASKELVLKEVAANTVKCEAKVDIKRRMTDKPKDQLMVKNLHKKFFNEVKVSHTIFLCSMVRLVTS